MRLTFPILLALLLTACAGNIGTALPDGQASDWVAGNPTDIPSLDGGEMIVDLKGPDDYIGPDVKYLGAAGR